MPNNLAIPDFALVTVLALRRADALRLIEKLDDAAVIEISVDRPEAMKTMVFNALDDGRTTAAYLPRSHAVARRRLAKWAKSAGAASVVIRIGDVEPTEPDEDHQHLYHIEPQQISEIEIRRTRMPVDLRHLVGPFDIIGDIHGCADELNELLLRLGHATRDETGAIQLCPHPAGRTVCLLGDLTDRGPKNRAALETTYRLHQEFDAIVVLGNHDHKLMRWLRGSNVRQAAGLQLTVAELELLSPSERQRFSEWLSNLQTHQILDHGRLVIAHAGLAEHLHGRASAEAAAFALYGEKSGEVDDEGIPLIKDWASDYAGSSTVVHGHVVTSTPRRLNNVISIDTGCVFGGSLTAYRYPEDTFVSVPAHAQYFEYRARSQTSIQEAPE